MRTVGRAVVVRQEQRGGTERGAESKVFVLSPTHKYNGIIITSVTARGKQHTSNCQSSSESSDS